MGNRLNRSHSSLKLYRILLSFFPSEFRNEYGYWMAQAFRDQLEDASSKVDRFFLWLRTIYDLFINALEEQMNEKFGGLKAFFRPSPIDRPFLWLCFFSLSTVVAFYLYRLVIRGVSDNLVDLILQNRIQVGPTNFVIRILQHGYTHTFVFSLFLAAFQALFFLSSTISARRWFLSSFIGWFVGIIAASQVWEITGPTLTVFLWRRSPALLPMIDILIQALVFGLVIGLTQMLAVWKKIGLYYLWPLITILAVLAHYLAFEYLSRNLNTSANLIFIPYLFSGLIMGSGLIFLIPRKKLSTISKEAEVNINSA